MAPRSLLLVWLYAAALLVAVPGVLAQSRGGSVVPRLLLLSAALAPQLASSTFTCCTHALCSANYTAPLSRPDCCASLFGATSDPSTTSPAYNSQAQCDALGQLYASTAGSGWHLHSDWSSSNLATADGYGGRHSPEDRLTPNLIDLITNADPPFFSTRSITDGTVASDHKAPPGFGRGADYFDFWKVRRAAAWALSIQALTHARSMTTQCLQRLILHPLLTLAQLLLATHRPHRHMPMFAGGRMRASSH